MIDDLGTVYMAEVARRIKSRPFLIGLVIGVLGIWALSALPDFFGNAFSGSDAIVVAGDARLVQRAKPLLANDYTIKAVLPDHAISPALLKQYDATAALILSQKHNMLDVAVLAKDPGSMVPARIRRDLLPLQLSLATHSTQTQVKALTAIPVHVTTIGSKFANSDQAFAARGIAYTLLFFLYMLILLNSQLVMSSVAEEKTSRIAELLIASVDPAALLAGKVLAALTLALLQLVVWAGAGVIFGSGAITGASASGSPVVALGGILSVITPFVLSAFLAFFIIGQLQLSTMFAAFASLINRTEDLGSVTIPLVMPVVFALFIAIGTLGAPDSPWSVTLSFVPLFAPFVMFARIAVSNVPLWQIAASLLINLLALWGIALLAGKIYRVGMLLYGRAPKLSQIWSVIRS
ncbi:MAG TPA: ABC transporter permease [Candidatus Baltobacteraceae bacterium]|jgi:ABC-2 type transport system permease protein|nr:ABC transporter permease [Candidatus Baltobacteraceae bacterium]